MDEPYLLPVEFAENRPWEPKDGQTKQVVCGASSAVFVAEENRRLRRRKHG